MTDNEVQFKVKGKLSPLKDSKNRSACELIIITVFEDDSFHYRAIEFLGELDLILIFQYSSF